MFVGEVVDLIEVNVFQDVVVLVEEVDLVVVFKVELCSKFGDWYVVYFYVGYENKVKVNLEIWVQNFDVGDYIFQVEVFIEEVIEIKNG